MIKSMDMALKYMLMVEYMKEIGRMEKGKGLELLHLMMVLRILGSIRIIKNMTKLALQYLSNLMETNGL